MNFTENDTCMAYDITGYPELDGQIVTIQHKYSNDGDVDKPYRYFAEFINESGYSVYLNFYEARPVSAPTSIKAAEPETITAITPIPKFAEFFDLMADGSRRMLDTLRNPDASNGGATFPLGNQAQIIEDWLNPSWNHNPTTVGALTYHYLNAKNNTVVLENKVRCIETFIDRMNDLLVSYANDHDLCSEFESIGIAGLNSLKEEVMPWCDTDFVGRTETVRVTVHRHRTIVETITFDMERPRGTNDYRFNEEAEELAANANDDEWEEYDSCYEIDDYNVNDVETL